MTDQTSPGGRDRLALSLFILRLALAAFLLQWGIEKFLHPEFSTRIGAVYYFGLLKGDTLFAVFGAVEVLVALSLLLGFMRRWGYLMAFLLHGVSTLVSLPAMLDPYFIMEAWGGYARNHALITGVPVLAAFWLLYWNRDLDRLWVLDNR